MELQDIRTNVRYRLGLNSDDRVARDAVLTALINSSIRQMSAEHDWSWLRQYGASWNLSAGTNVYGLVATQRRILWAKISDQNESLKLVTPDFAAKYSQQTGTPRYYYVDNGGFNLFPTPHKAMVMNYSYLTIETPLANDTDEPLVPDWAIEWVIVTTARMLAARLDDGSQYQMLTIEANNIMKGLKNDARNAAGTPTIDSRRDW